MDPLTMGAVLAGTGAVGSILGKQKANSDERKRLDAIIAKLERDWQNPEYDMTPITPEEFKMLSEFVPEVAPFVAERYPQVVTEKSAQPYIQAQREALRRLQQEATTGEDAAAAYARERAGTEASARQEAIRQQALSRLAASGRLDAGAATAAELGGVQDASQMARQEYMQAAADREARRRQAMGQATQLAGQMREGEFRREATAADVINDFNRRAVDRRQAHMNKAAQTRNQARQANLQQRQSVADANVQLRNQLIQSERDRQDRIAREKTGSANTLLKTVAGLEQQKPISAPWWYPVAQGTGQIGTQMVTQGISQMGKEAAPTGAYTPPANQTPWRGATTTPGYDTYSADTELDWKGITEQPGPYRR